MTLRSVIAGSAATLPGHTNVEEGAFTRSTAQPIARDLIRQSVGNARLERSALCCGLS
jgi:hypothetical protein